MPIGVGIKNTDAEIRDGVLSDATKIAGARIDEKISDPKTLTAAERTSIQSKILSDATPFAGADVGDIKAKTDNLPTDPADESLLEAHVTSEVDDLITRTKGLNDIHDDLVTVDGVVDDIKTQTDKQAGESPTESSTTKNWNTVVDSPDGDGGLVVSFGVAATKKKVHSLLLDVSALTDTAVIHVKLFIKINGNEKKVYDETFTIGTDTDGLWIINGTLAIHDILKVAVKSDTSESKAIGYTIVSEAM